MASIYKDYEEGRNLMPLEQRRLFAPARRATALLNLLDALRRTPSLPTSPRGLVLQVTLGQQLALPLRAGGPCEARSRSR